MMILRLERGCQSTEMGRWTHPAGKGWDGGLSLLGSSSQEATLSITLVRMGGGVCGERENLRQQKRYGV